VLEPEDLELDLDGLAVLLLDLFPLLVEEDLELLEALDLEDLEGLALDLLGELDLFAELELFLVLVSVALAGAL